MSRDFVVTLFLPEYRPGSNELISDFQSGIHLPIFQHNTYMKPHLPASLFRALVAAAIALPAYTFGGYSDIPDTYITQSVVTSTSGVAGSDPNMAFLIKPSSNVTNPTMAWSGETVIEARNSNVLFTSWSNDNLCTLDMSFGSHLITVGDLTFVSLYDVSMDSNKQSIPSSSTATAYGGAVIGGTSMTHNEEGNLTGYGRPDSTVKFERNRNIYLTRNEINLTVSNGNIPVRAYGYGAVIVSPKTVITGNKDVTIDTNFLNVKATTHNNCYADARGGALYGNTIEISNNEDVSIQGNRLEMVTSGPLGVARGAAIYSNHSVSITGNNSVTIRNNALHYKTRNDEAYYLESIYIESGNQGLLTLAAGAGKAITLYDRICVDTNVTINATFTNQEGQDESATGDVIFSARFADEDLKAYLKEMRGAGNETPTPQESLLSCTSVALGTTTLHAGRMQICDGAIYNGGGFIANPGSTLYMRAGTLLGNMPETVAPPMGDGRTVFRTGSGLHLKGVNSFIDSVETVFEGNNSFTFDITALNHNDSSILINDNVTFNAGTTVYITSDNQLSDAIYHLISIPEEYTVTGWVSANITVSSNEDIGFTATYANLIWETDGNGMRHLNYYTTQPKLRDAEWTNGNGDYVWSFNAINWQQDGQPYAFSNGATATFTDAGHTGGAGVNDTIYLKGEIRPADVIVDNTVDAPYTWVADNSGGKLSGEMSLTKRGTGSLTVALANDYSGNTVVEGGTLIAGNAKAFGTGTITVTQGGALDLGNYAVTNTVRVDAGSFSGTGYAGELQITGNAVIGENTTAKSVYLNPGRVAGGSFINTTITAVNATIGDVGKETLLIGKTNLISHGKTTLRGNHTSTGTFTVMDGTFVLEGSTTADIVIQSGSMLLDNKMTLANGQELTFNGGNLHGSVATADGSGINTNVSTIISENLDLNGGVFTPGGQGIILTVGGQLNILNKTDVNVSAYVNGGSYVLANAGSIIGDETLLNPYTDTRNENTISKNGSGLLLTVVEKAATLHWNAGATGKWEQRGDTEWDVSHMEDPSSVDPIFYNRDKVVFDKGGTVEIVGEVKPASITVTGSEEVSLSGSGSIGGSTGLEKQDSCTLNMNANNTYTGGTAIREGTVNAGGAGSFGTGNIQLHGGHVNMGNFAVKNNVVATGGKFSGTAYNGTITVQGDLAVGDDTTAKQIDLVAGSIKEGSLKDTNIAVKGNSAIESALKGNTNLTVESGEIVLSGDNSSTGTTTVNGGTLSYAKEKAFGSGDIYLNGGRIQATEIPALILTGKQALHFRGGSITGNVNTGNSTSLVLDNDARIEGNLKLNGGTIYFNGKGNTNTPMARGMMVSSNGCTLSVSGSLTLSADTVINLAKGQYADGDILIEADSLTNDDISRLILDYDDGNPNTEYALVLRETDEKIQILLDLDKVYEHVDGKWTVSREDLRDLLVQSNWGMFASSHAFTDALQGQRSASGLIGDNGVMVWASGLYSHMTVNDDGAKNGADADSLGAAVGFETMVGSRSCIGMAVGVTSTDISASNILDKMEQDGTYVGVYGATVLSRLSETSGLTFSWSAAYGSVESAPSTAGSGIEWQQDSFQLNGRVDWSRSISDTTTVNLFAGMEYFLTTSDSVFGIDSGEIRNLRAELGAGITRRFSATVLYAEARLLGDIVRDDPAPTIDGVSEEGANPGTVGAGVRVGAAYDINPYWSVGANGSVEIMGDAVSAGANVGASVRF